MATRLVCFMTVLSLLFGVFGGSLGGILVGPGTAQAQDDLETILAQIEAVAAGEPDYTDRFRYDDEAWDTTYDDTVFPFYEAGTFHIWINDPSYLGYSLSTWEAGDFYLEVDSYHVFGPLDNSFGIVFRYLDEDNFYYFAASSNGYYAFFRRVDGVWETILDWSESSEIIVGEGGPNWLGVFAVGNQITLLINRAIVNVAEDDTFAYGGFALAAETYAEGGIEIAFDDLRLWGVDDPNELIVDPEPTITPTPAAPTPMPPALPTDAAQADYADDFTTESPDWPISSVDTHTQWYADGRLHMRLLVPNRIAWVINERTRDPGLDDFYVEVEMTDIAGLVNSQNGFIFRFQDGDNFYLFGISGQSTYSVWRKVAGEWLALIPWTASPLLNGGVGAVNHIGLLAEGPSFTLFANDQFLAAVEDTSLAQGGVGIMASSYDETGVEIAFDEFALWTLGAALAAPVDAQETGSATPAPTNTPPAATPTLVPTDAPPASLTIEEELAAIRLGNTTFSDEFRRDSGRWTFAADGAAEMLVTQRELHIRVEQEIVFAVAAHDLEVADFYVEADFRHIGEPTDAEYGFLVRYDASTGDYLSFTIDASGTYQIARQVGNDWEALTDWEDSAVLASGADAVNRLGVFARDNALFFVANNEVLVQLEDPNPQPGTVALMVGSLLDPEAEIAIDNVDLWDLSP